MPFAPRPQPGGKYYGAPDPELTPEQRAAIEDALSKMRADQFLKWVDRLQARDEYHPNDVPGQDWADHSWLFSNGPFGSPGANKILGDAHDEWVRRRAEMEKQRPGATPPPMAPKAPPPHSSAPVSPTPPQADHGAITGKPAVSHAVAAVASTMYAQMKLLNPTVNAAPAVHGTPQ